MTATLEETFNAALAADAQRTPAIAPAPTPRKSDNPDAPHGFAEDGTTPLAPYGHKADGRPRIKPGGPGRAGRGRDDAARVTPDVSRETSAGGAASPSPAGTGPDFTAELTDLGMTVWLGASVLRGGKLLFLKVPDARPYAMLWHANLPVLIGAWNTAARQNATVREYVRKFGGDGSHAWIMGVAITTVSFVSACAEMAKLPADKKAIAAAANDKAIEQFMTAQLDELGITDADPAAGIEGSP